MAWDLCNDRPIYSQIVEIIRLRIVSGYYLAGDKLPSVRELAAEAGVNPNTMQKALADLEKSGLLVTMRTSGRVVTEDTALILQVKESIARSEIKSFLDKMSGLGFDLQQATEFVYKVLEEEKET